MSIMFWMITAQMLYMAYENLRDKLRLWMLNSSREDLEHTYLIQTKIELLEVHLKVCFGLFLVCSYLEYRSINTLPSIFSRFEIFFLLSLSL